MPAARPVVLVTGSSRGIGHAVAIQFANAGYRVMAHYRSRVTQAKSALARLHGTGHALLQADLADSAAAGALVQRTISRFSRLDVLVNNAGVYQTHPILKVSSRQWNEAWQRTLATNLLGPAQLCHAAARQMVKQGGGRIVNISSRGAFRGEPLAPAYAASKAGLNALSQSLALALGPHKIYVFAVAPGWVDTEMATGHVRGRAGAAIKRESPLGRIASVDEVAQTVLYLGTQAAEYLTGAILDLNGASYLRS